MAIVVAVFSSAAVEANAQKRNERDVKDALRALNSSVSDFEDGLRDRMRSSSANSNDIAQASDDVRELRDRISHFQRNFESKRENRNDVIDIVESAEGIQSFLDNEPQNRQIDQSWSNVKRQIDRISSNYGITNSWQSAARSPQYPDNSPSPSNVPSVTVGLSGTYDLDMPRSEKTADVLSSLTLSDDQRSDLQEKLDAPPQIALDIRGQQVVIATTNSSPVTLTADGRDRSNGGTERTRTAISGDQLTLSRLGSDSDFTITFRSESNGSILKVTRRITTPYLNSTVFIESIYNRSDVVARLGIDTGDLNTNGGWSDSDGGGSNGSVGNNGNNGNNGSYGAPPVAVAGRTGNFIVPNGTVINGLLLNPIDTKASQNNDKFKLRVDSPSEFKDAVIDGYISGLDRSGKISGRSKVTFNFSTITLADGKTYDFAGSLQSIKDQNGKLIKVDNEGSARSSSQTNETVKRGGIGAGLGALIGAIAGGAKGAAIGAAIGAGAGAGSMIFTGKEDLRLLDGSSMTIQSSSPIRSSDQPK